MRRIATLFVVVVVSALGYYYTFGAKQLTAELRSVVGWHLEELELNGFQVELIEQEESSDRFLITAHDTKRIGAYLQHYDIDINDEDATLLDGFKLTLKIGYLQGFFHALSADFYPAALPSHLTQNPTPLQQKFFKKIIEERLFWGHIDINQWMSEYSGYLKDIDGVFEGDERLSLKVGNVQFGGEYDGTGVVSSQLRVDKLLILKEKGFRVELEGATTSFRRFPQTNYDFNATYSALRLKLKIDNFSAFEGENLTIHTHAQGGKGALEESLVDVGVTANASMVRMSHGDTPIEVGGLVWEVHIDDIATLKLDTMKEGEMIETPKLLSTAITPKTQLILKRFDFSNLSLGDGGSLGGFRSHGRLTLSEGLDWDRALDYPIIALPHINLHLEMLLSNSLYDHLRSMPELSLLWMGVTPIDQNGSKYIEFDYGKTPLQNHQYSTL